MMECGDIDLEEEKPAVPPPVHAKPLPPVTESAYSLLGEVGGNTPPMIPRRTADSHGVGESTPEVMKRAGGGGGGMTEDGLYELAAPIGMCVCTCMCVYMYVCVHVCVYDSA